MLIAAIKLGDIAARSLFLLIALYTLPARASGQFGLALTLIALFAFFSGFERYLDLQRSLVGKSPPEVNKLILATLRFFAVGHLLWLTPLALLLHYWAQLDRLAVLLWSVIAVCEHLSTEAYRVALISSRHRWILLAGLIKNLLLMVVAAVFAMRGQALELEQLLWTWTAFALLAAIASAAMLRTLSAQGPNGEASALVSLRTQLRQSRTHFMIGLVALTSLQIDRLMAGGFLSLEETGLYFRHVFVAAAAYQAFGVVSHNRIMHRLYGHLQAQRRAEAMLLIRSERRRYLALSLAVIAAAFLTETQWAANISALDSITPAVLIILLLAYTVRGVADYNAMVLNATYRERSIFRAQSITVLVVLALGAALTPSFGIAGLVAATLMGASVYACLTWMFVSRTAASPLCKL